MSKSDTNKRLDYLETMMENFQHVLTTAAQHPNAPVSEVLAQMPSIVRHGADGEAQPEHHYVIPDGYPMPAESLAEAQQQYADALRELEIVNRAIADTASSYTDIVVRPPKLDQALIVIIPLLHAIAKDVRENLTPGCDTCKPVISQGIANAVLAWVDASAGASTAISEFADWAWGTLLTSDDERSSIVLSNLKATGVV